MSERTRNRKSYKEAVKTVQTRGHITPKDKKFLTKESYPKGSLGDRSNQKILNTPTPGEKQKAERLLRRTQKNAAKRYMTKVTAEKAAKAAKIAKVAKVAKVTPVGIIAGVALDKGSEFARKKFVEADMRKMSKINKRNQALDQQMDSLRKKNQGRINIK
tara:strand:- start:174 stop:653 length:480 start_codon:yes stop_codon:yes gene_type:complete